MNKKIICMGIVSLFLLTSVTAMPTVRMKAESKTSEIKGLPNPIQTTMGDNTIYVDDNRLPGWYDETHVKTITEGITNASDGDTVYVYSGTYTEEIEIREKSIELIGDNLISPIINGEIQIGTHTEIISDVTVSGFTITKNDPEEYFLAIKLYNSNNILIKDNRILNSNSFDGTGILLFGASNSSIINNKISNNKGVKYFAGILFGPSASGNKNNLIQGNKITGNTADADYSIGIDLHGYFDSDNKIIDNVVSDNEKSGIVITHDTSNSIISGNTINNNQIGIQMYSFYPTGGRSGPENNTICDNDISKNYQGILIKFGINRNNISENQINSNSYGIVIDPPTDDYGNIMEELINKENTIIKNTITDNKIYGIMVDILNFDNHFYHNNFLRNGGVISGGNAKDEGNNQWDDENKGNYWDDYTKKYSDAQKNETIWDTPYDIDGGDNQDRFPLVNAKGKSKTNRFIFIDKLLDTNHVLLKLILNSWKMILE